MISLAVACGSVRVGEFHSLAGARAGDFLEPALVRGSFRGWNGPVGHEVRLEASLSIAIDALGVAKMEAVAAARCSTSYGAGARRVGTSFGQSAAASLNTADEPHHGDCI